MGPSYEHNKNNLICRGRASSFPSPPLDHWMPRPRCQYTYELRDRYADPAESASFRAAAANAKRMRFFKKGGGSPSAAVPLTVEAEEAVERASSSSPAAAEVDLSPSKTATLVAGGGKSKKKRGGSANGEDEVLIKAQFDPEVKLRTLSIVYKSHRESRD